jgi:two-component system, cell cycle sensor histidine kinase and response regulator CckA
MNNSEEKKANMNETAEVLQGNVFQMNPTVMKLQNRKAMSEMFQDDIKQSRVQSQFIQSMKMQSLGVFAGTLAHDFNNILGTILMSSSMLEMNRMNPEKYPEILKAINKAVGQGAELLGQILAFTGKTDIIRTPLSVHSFINDFLSEVKQTFPANIKIQEMIEQNIPSISADHAKMHQIMLNLCSNAREAMADGGTLTVGVKSVAHQDIQTLNPFANHDHYICISISDTGTGIEEAAKNMVFDPFYSTKGKGRGLGLSIVYGIVQAHHGFIDLESKPSYGSTFYLYFPIITVKKERINSIQERKLSNICGTETILVVEDEKSLLDLARLIFESKGYTVLAAKDGVEAVEMYKQNREKISIVFTDIGLPRLNGRDMFAKLKEIDPDVKVIFTSGIFIDIKAELLRNGAKDFIQKPYKQEDVLRKIREVLDAL